MMENSCVYPTEQYLLNDIVAETLSLGGREAQNLRYKNKDFQSALF